MIHHLVSSERSRKYLKTSILGLLAVSPMALANTNAEESLIQDPLKFDSLAGSGYSTDTQRRTSIRCFNTIVARTSARSKLSEETSKTLDEVKDELGISAELSVGYGLFSADAKFDYCNEMAETDNSFTFHYIYEVKEEIELEVAPEVTPEVTSVLNKDGQFYYGKENFNIVCGDEYISSSYHGARLILTFKLSFKDKLQKDTVKAELGAKFKLVEVSAKLERLSERYKSDCSVDIIAIQDGGQPEELHKILKYDKVHHYYINSCDIKDMDSCIKTVDGLLDYADKFSTQIKTGSEPQGLTLLGFKHLPIYFIGLTPKASYVTDEVRDNRDYLAAELTKNQQYKKGLEKLINSYPVRWDISSLVYRNLLDLLDKVTDNEKILLDPDNGGLQCYQDPRKCKDITERIKRKLKPVDKSKIEEIKYIMPLIVDIPEAGIQDWDLGVLYRVGDGDHGWAGYFPKPHPAESDEKLQDVTLGDQLEFHYNIWLNSRKNLCIAWSFHAGSHDAKSIDGITYQNRFNINENCPGTPAPLKNAYNVSFTKKLSPFYFIVDENKIVEKVRASNAKEEL